jgi:hypothetical protein
VGLPDFLTVEDAAAVLRIGRTAAYEPAQRYRATGGAEGLPVVVLGRLLRVPRAQLEALAGGLLGEPNERSSRPAPADRPRPSRQHLRPVAADVPPTGPSAG